MFVLERRRKAPQQSFVASLDWPLGAEQFDILVEMDGWVVGIRQGRLIGSEPFNGLGGRLAHAVAQVEHIAGCASLQVEPRPSLPVRTVPTQNAGGASQHEDRGCFKGKQGQVVQIQPPVVPNGRSRSSRPSLAAGHS